MASQVLIVAVCGGSGSGKSTFAKLLQRRVGVDKASILSQDSYYIDQSAKFTGDGSVNFDHPSALELNLMAKHLHKLRMNEDVEIPLYDYATHKRTLNTLHFQPCPVIICDGTLLLTEPSLREQFHTSVFLEVPDDVRLNRRLKRDVLDRARTEEGVRKQFTEQVRPMHNQFVEPSKEFADVILRSQADMDRIMEMLSIELRATL